MRRPLAALSKDSILLKVLGDSPKLRIIDFFIGNRLFDFTKKEVIEATGMSKPTFYKYFPSIERSGVVKVTRRIGRAKLYRLNTTNLIVRKLDEMTDGISLQVAKRELKRAKPR